MSVYGCQLWDFSSKVANDFYIAWRKCIRRLVSLPYTTHNRLLHIICNDIPVDLQLHKRFVTFFIKALNSNNTSVKLCAKLAFNGSRSNACRSKPQLSMS